ncbi:MAG: molybdopterin-dependent oxidoreductase [Rhodobacterales bacterium]|nr:molybdopterin-dependent oxidoreductase [Rhodobacterales bacterium]
MADRRPISLSHWGPFTATVEGGRLTAATPLPGSGADPAMVGAWPELVHGNLRIPGPMVRQSYLKDGPKSDRAARGLEPFVPVSWDTALDLAAGEIARVRAERGPTGVFAGSYGWSSAGRLHHARTQIRRFHAAAGGFTDQVGNYSWGAAQAILPYVLGDHRAVSADATDWTTLPGNCDTVVAFGGLNPKNWHVTSGGAGAFHLPDVARAARDAGVRFVMVSPFKGDVPDGLDATWIQPRPNTDTALMLGLAHEILRRGAENRAFLNRYCAGVDRLETYIRGGNDGRPKDLAWAAAVADVPVDALSALVDRLVGGRSFLTASWSLQRADQGEQAYWMLIALAALLGGIGRPGQGFGFGNGSMNGVGATRRRGLVPGVPVPPNPDGLAIPAARVTDMLLHPGRTIPFDGGTVTYPDVGLVHWAGGNPFHHQQDLNRLVRAWARPETVIVQDPWWTPAAKRADIVLPATTPAERADIGGSSRDAFLFAMAKLVDPVGGARHDRDILADLAGRLGCAEAFTGGLDEGQWLDHLFDTLAEAARAQGLTPPDRDAFWRDGVWAVPPPPAPEVLLADFRADPQGRPLATPSGRIVLASDVLAAIPDADIPAHPTWREPAEWLGGTGAARHPLHLLTNQPARRLHSQLAQTAAGRSEQVDGRERIRLHPDEAAARGLAAGAVARVFNDRGACLAVVTPDPGLRPGVALMATGAWYDPDTDGTDRGGNPNVLTRDAGTSDLGQASTAQTALVQVAPLAGPAPRVEAYDPPPVIPA